MTHAELLAEIRKICAALGLLAIYHPDSRHAWSRGAPDLLIVGRRGVLHREVKTEHDDTTAAQDLWGWTLTQAGADWAVWRPSALAAGVIRSELEAIA